MLDYLKEVIQSLSCIRCYKVAWALRASRPTVRLQGIYQGSKLKWQRAYNPEDIYDSITQKESGEVGDNLTLWLQAEEGALASHSTPEGLTSLSDTSAHGQESALPVKLHAGCHLH